MRRGIPILLFTSLLLLGTSLAQVVITSTVLGTVSDPQGAFIPNAAVKLRNIDTGGQWTATTNTTGGYQFPNLIAGHYRVEISANGFSKAASTVVALENGTTQRINVTLTVGGSEEVVQVTSAAR